MAKTEDAPAIISRGALVGLARAFAGAVIFSLPMLMTMELWSIGFYVPPLKICVLLLVMLPLLVGLSRIAGFEPTSTLGDDVVDAFVAIAVAAVVATGVLLLFGIIFPAMPASEVIGKIAVQTFPGSLGAILARSQLGAESVASDRGGEESYAAALLTMAAGALFLGLNVAPTEEIVLLTYKMETWRIVVLAAFSLLLMHGFVYVASFRGSPESVSGATAFWIQFLRFTVVGYAMVLIISLYLLWTFGRTEATSMDEIAGACVVLGFPAALGAAASRLIL
jgi:putative integral membrane protein (TIGR02587 family)